MSNEHKIEDPAEMAITTQPMTGHPGPFIRDVLLKEYKLNVAATTRRLGINRSHFIAVLDGKGSVTRDLAYKLGALMRDEVADLLIAWQLKHDLAEEAEQRAAYRETIERVDPVEATS